MQAHIIHTVYITVDINKGSFWLTKDGIFHINAHITFP